MAKENIAFPSRDDKSAFSPGSDAWRLEQRRQPDDEPGTVSHLGHQQPTRGGTIRCRQRAADRGVKRIGSELSTKVNELFSLLADHASRVEGSRTGRSNNSGASIRRGRRSWYCASGTAVRHTYAGSRRFPQAARGSDPGVPEFLHPLGVCRHDPRDWISPAGWSIGAAQRPLAPS